MLKETSIQNAINNTDATAFLDNDMMNDSGSLTSSNISSSTKDSNSVSKDAENRKLYMTNDDNINGGKISNLSDGYAQDTDTNVEKDSKNVNEKIPNLQTKVESSTEITDSLKRPKTIEEFESDNLSLGNPKRSCGDESTTASDTRKKLVDNFKALSSDEQLEYMKNFVKSSYAYDKETVSHCCRELNGVIKVDFIKKLPSTVVEKIFSYLNATSLCKATEVSRTWRKAASADALWHRLCVQHINRKCTKCGWGLPLSRSCAEEAKPLSSSSSKWKNIYACRMQVERNWRKGKSKKTEYLGHTDAVTCLEFSDDLIVSGSKDCTVRIWSFKEQRCIKVLNGHNAPILALQFDKMKIICGDKDGVIRICNISTGECVRTMEGHKGAVQDLQFDSERLVTAGEDSTIKIWNFTNGKCCSLYGHTDQVNCVRIHGDQLLSTSDDATLRIWNLKTKQCINTLQGHHSEVLCGQLSHSRVLSGSADNTIKIWSLPDAKCTKTIFGHTDSVRFVQFDNLRIASASDDGTIRIWDLESGALTHTLTSENKTAINTLQFSDTKIVAGLEDSSVLVWDFSAYCSDC